MLESRKHLITAPGSLEEKEDQGRGIDNNSGLTPAPTGLVSPQRAAGRRQVR
jgi:hypothetical protein